MWIFNNIFNKEVRAKDKYLKSKYMNRDVSLVYGNVSVSLRVSGVKGGRLYAFMGDKELCFSPDKVVLDK